MCCLVLLLMIFGPRVTIVLWWLFDMSRWQSAFDSAWVALAGFVLLPWTTLGYVLVAPTGEVAGFDWMLLALAFITDLATHGGGVRERFS